MKKHYFLMAFLFIAIATFAQDTIPNGNFERWNSTTTMYPTNYPYSPNHNSNQSFPATVTRVTPAWHGNYALQLSTIVFDGDTNAGGISNIDFNKLNGNPTTFAGGLPYTQKPTGIRGYYKYNVASADSALVLAVFSKGGSNIETYAYKIGGIKTSYTLFDFKFSPALTTTPDSAIFIVFASNMMISHSGVPGSTLIIDSVSFTGVSSQPTWMNGDFESWSSQTSYTPADWYSENADSTSLIRSTDAEKGSYALELKTYLGNQNNHASCQMAQVQNAPITNTCCFTPGGTPFSNQIDTLAFWYKYTAASVADTAFLGYNFKLNGSNIFGNMAKLPATSGSSYQYMTIPFNLGKAPDTVVISIQPDNWYDTLLTSVGSDLKIDEIHFLSHPLTTNIFNLKNGNAINTYPNPASSIITLVNPGKTPQTYIATITNSLGKDVMKEEIDFSSANTISVADLSNGVYMLTLKNDKTSYVSKIVIQK